MREMDLTELLPEIVLRSRCERRSASAPVFLTISPNLPSFCWNDNSLEDLILMFVDRAISAGHPERPIRVAVVRRMKLADIEAMLNIHPSHWIQMKIDIQPSSEALIEIRKKLQSLGFGCEEAWIAEDSTSQLILFSCEDPLKPPLVFYVEDRKTNHRCSLLIPIEEPATAC